jgi:hypothetical protein
MLGEFAISLPGNKIMECTGIRFFWKYEDGDDKNAIEEMFMVLEGTVSELRKALEVLEDKNGRSGSIKEEAGNSRAGIMLKMNRELVTKVNEWSASETQGDLYDILVGGTRNAQVFDFSNYSVISTEVE